MDIGFKEDKNGKIDDSDELFDRIDERLDNEEYDAVISEIMSIPREKQSNKLRFKLVTAYSNKREFQKARAELDKVRPLCVSPNDHARYRYQRGYICYMNDKEILARRYYSEASEIDPEYAKEIALEEDIADCDSLIAENLANFHGLCKAVSADIGLRCSQNSEKKQLSAEEFKMRLGFFPAIRALPGFERAMGFDGYSDKLKGEERDKTRQWFANFYDVTDTESFYTMIQKHRDCNLARMTDDAMAFLVGSPSFDIKDLNEDGKFSFGNAVAFVRQFGEFLPRGGTLAWDIGEKIGFARHAHRCGVIGDDDYSRVMELLSNMAKDHFSSWDEYIRSLIFGAAMFVYSLDEWNIVGAIRFTADMMKLIMRWDLADVSWG